MEFELANCNRFLDVSEFTLLMPKESPYLCPSRKEINIAERNQVSSRSLHGKPSLTVSSGCFHSENLSQDESPSVDALSDVDFMTPFMLYDSAEDTDELSDFELDVELEYIQEQPENPSLSEQDSDQEQGMTVDLLDAIEQECERQLSLGLHTACFVEETVPPAVSEVKEEEPESLPNNYNWLSFKENNIESLAYQGSNCDYLLEDRKTKVERYLFKRMNRSWGKKISYICRKQVADARLRVKGRFITRAQANIILGMDTSDLTLDEIKSLIDSKLSFKDKELSETAEGFEDLK